MLNAGVLAFDSSGRIKSISPPPSKVNFNGGTPTGELGSLVVADLGAGPNYNGGLRYSDDGSLSVSNGGVIAGYVQGGLPVDLTGHLVVTYDGLPASWLAGIPFTSGGRVAVALPVAPTNFFAFSNAFSTAFDTEASP